MRDGAYRRVWRAALRWWAGAVTVAVALAGPVGAVTVDPTHAEVDLQQAEAQLQQIEGLLDQRAADYERAQQHVMTLEQETGVAEQRVEAAREVWSQADAQAEAAIRQRYVHPTAAGTWALRVLTRSGSVGAALHQIALRRHLPSRRIDQAEAAARASILTSDEQRQHATILTGAAQAATDLEEERARLDAALAAAAEEVDVARAELEDARRVAAEQAAVQAALTAAQQAAERGLIGRQTVQADTPAAWPPVMACPLGLPNGFSSSWGAPRSGGRQHRGVDMFAARGTPVVAAGEGIVRVGRNGLGGLTVDLYDVAGNRYYYAHLDSVQVGDGQSVEAGQVLGGAGTSGNAVGTPPHLHWQVHPGGGGPVDPFPLADALCRP
jgi:murein DD-endopeptidase MepM/ murein hydrolase activator NlpD